MMNAERLFRVRNHASILMEESDCGASATRSSLVKSQVYPRHSRMAPAEMGRSTPQGVPSALGMSQTQDHSYRSDNWCTLGPRDVPHCSIRREPVNRNTVKQIARVKPG